jgi:hypothetical protein
MNLSATFVFPWTLIMVHIFRKGSLKRKANTNFDPIPQLQRKLQAYHITQTNYKTNVNTVTKHYKIVPLFPKITATLYTYSMLTVKANL